MDARRGHHKRRRASPQSSRRAEPAFDPDAPVWIYGLHAVAAALANPARAEPLRLVATGNAARELPRGTGPELLEPKALSKLLPEGAVHQGVALLAPPLAQPSLKELLAAKGTGPLVFLDQVTDPHNVGAILRSTAAFGAAGVVTTKRHAPAITGVLAKAASGAIEHVPYVQVTNLAEALAEAGEAGFMRLGLDEAGDILGDALARARGGRIALVLGAEGPGLRAKTRETCDALVRLPTAGAFATLNVSNAAAVALYAISAANRHEP